MAATSTLNLTTVLTDAEENIAPVVKEVERTFCFTDVPCGAMKFTNEEPKPNPEVKDDVSQGILAFCGGLERAFCFSDLQDIDESDIERIKTLSNLEREAPQKDDSPPAVEPADTESMSDESAKDEEEAAKKEEPKAEEKPAETTAAALAKAEQPEKKAEEIKKTESTSLPPANALQAANHSTRDGKPMNSLQAAKAAKKEGKKKGWRLFRRSSRKGSA